MRSNLRLSTRKSQGVAGLSEDDLRQLADAGFTIGGHTLTHADLARINDMDTLIHEVAEDKRRLERISGQPVHYFAYPYGSFRNPNHLLPRILAAVGYRAATTTLPGFNTPESDRYLLKRELTNAEMSSCVFRARVLGNTDGAQFLRHWVWQRLPGRFDAGKMKICTDLANTPYGPAVVPRYGGLYMRRLLTNRRSVIVLLTP